MLYTKPIFRRMSFVAGRRAIYMPNHVGANNGGYILFSRWLMEKHLGKILESREEVHHMNENPFDDRVENYELLSKSNHARLHHLAGRSRELDYAKITELMKSGMGCRRIAKLLTYKLSSTKYAMKLIRASK